MIETFQIIEGPVANLASYASIPISFVISSRLDLDNLWLGEYVEKPVSPTTKDYDTLEPISTLPERFDVRNWIKISVLPITYAAVVSAPVASHPVGGAILAWDTPGVDMLEGRKDLAVLWDIRVHPLFRRNGLGQTLFEEAKKCAKRLGCTEMRVETQDTNVGACRFYRHMGCRLHSIHEQAYEGLDEAKILWTCKP